MDCLLFLVTVVFAALHHPPQSLAAEWQDDIRNGSTLLHVVMEYESDIMTVEAAGSKCADGQRKLLTDAQNSLKAVLATCTDSSGEKREVLKQCVESKTTRTVSEVRQHITLLKACLDRGV